MKPPRGVPRDEWLLAVGLGAEGPDWCGPNTDSAVAWRIGGGAHSPDWSASWNGSHAMTCDEYHDCPVAVDEGNPDAYAAGAALAMALEAE